MSFSNTRIGGLERFSKLVDECSVTKIMSQAYLSLPVHHAHDSGSVLDALIQLVDRDTH
jgi:hypothetical protein